MLLFSRRELLVAAAVTAFSTSVAAATRSTHVLFVCQFGTVKSPIAREVLKRRAAERGIPLVVSARGISPQDHITAELKLRLARDGINPSAEPLRQLQSSDLAAADLVIIFDQLPPDLRPRMLEDWSDMPSFVNDYPHARAVLDARINRLLDDIASR